MADRKLTRRELVKRAGVGVAAVGLGGTTGLEKDRKSVV